MEHLQVHVSRDDSDTERDDQSRDESEELTDKRIETPAWDKDEDGLYTPRFYHLQTTSFKPLLKACFPLSFTCHSLAYYAFV